jgi:hypothetical protein
VRSFDFAGSVLSDDGRGNHWGLTCEQGGFVSPDAAVIDDPAAYGEPVAEVPDDQLPATCD